MVREPARLRLPDVHELLAASRRRNHNPPHGLWNPLAPQVLSEKNRDSFTEGGFYRDPAMKLPLLPPVVLEGQRRIRTGLGQLSSTPSCSVPSFGKLVLAGITAVFIANIAAIVLAAVTSRPAAR